MEEIRVLLVEPDKEPRLVTVEHRLENLQKMVGGTLQAVYPWTDAVILVCDDDGKGKGYPPNRMLLDEYGVPYDVVAGSFFICGIGHDDFASISDEMAEKYRERFLYPEIFLPRPDGGIFWHRIGSGEGIHLIG